MAALTASGVANYRGEGKTYRLKMADDSTVFANGMVMLNAGGLAVSAVADASNTGVWGVAIGDYTNPAGGDVHCEVKTGEFRFVAVSIVQGNVGDVMYALDDQTFDETQLANQPQCGKLSEFISATSGWVLIGPEFAS